MSTDPEQFGLVVDAASGQRITVGLDSTKKVFGRWPAPHTDVQLRNELVAKNHFEIRWNAVAATHEIQDYGQLYSPTLNGSIVRGECRLLRPADVLAIGQYTIQYVDVRRAPSTAHSPTDWTDPSSRK